MLKLVAVAKTQARLVIMKSGGGVKGINRGEESSKNKFNLQNSSQNSPEVAP